MIRVFKLFCKLIFINFSAEDFFLESMAEFNPYKHKCPCCGAKHPDWEKHSCYDRYLISFENSCVSSCQITIVRYKCSSCGHTHAVLPESIIPYRSYSFLFIISVMMDYFKRPLTIEGICDKYNISVSTLYSWKKLFLQQKKLWLGLLENAYTSAIQFLNSFLDETRIYELEDFFKTASLSFLQGTRKKAKYNPP